MANGKGKKIVSKSQKSGLKAGIARGLKAGKRGKKEVVALSYSDIPKYKAAQMGAYGAMKYVKGDKGGKKDYMSMPFRNRDIDRIRNPKTGRKNYQDYIDGL